MSKPSKQPAEPDTPLEQKILEEVGTSRMREFKGALRVLVFALAIGLSFFHLYTAAFGTIYVMFQRCVHIGLVSALVFLLYPFSKKRFKNRVTLLDVVWIGLSLAAFIYPIIAFEGPDQSPGDAQHDRCDFRGHHHPRRPGSQPPGDRAVHFHRGLRGAPVRGLRAVRAGNAGPPAFHLFPNHGFSVHDHRGDLRNPPGRLVDLRLPFHSLRGFYHQMRDGEIFHRPRHQHRRRFPGRAGQRWRSSPAGSTG